MKKKLLLAILQLAGYAVTNALPYASAVDMVDALRRTECAECPRPGTPVMADGIIWPERDDRAYVPPSLWQAALPGLLKSTTPVSQPVTPSAPPPRPMLLPVAVPMPAPSGDALLAMLSAAPVKPQPVRIPSSDELLAMLA